MLALFTAVLLATGMQPACSIAVAEAALTNSGRKKVQPVD